MVSVVPLDSIEGALSRLKVLSATHPDRSKIDGFIEECRVLRDKSRKWDEICNVYGVFRYE